MSKAMVTIDYSFTMKDTGRPNGGISNRDFKERIGIGNRKNRELFIERVAGNAGFYSLPYFEKETRKILKFSSSLRKRFDNLVVLGTGGSALGTSAVTESLQDRLGRKGGEILVFDNIDPDKFAYIISKFDLSRTIFNVISKSGNTSETLSLFFITSRILRRRIGKNWKEHIIITTDPERGVLRDMVRKMVFSLFPFHPLWEEDFPFFPQWVCSPLPSRELM